MAAITKTTLGKAGTAEPTLAAATGGGDTVASPTNRDVLIVDNQAVSGITVTLAVPGTNFAGTANADTAITVGATTRTYIKLDSAYNNSGTVAVTYSAVASVTVGVFTI